MEKSRWLSVFLKHAAPVGLFIFLPLLVAAYLGYHTITLEREKHVDLLTRNLETSLTQANCEADTEVFLKKVARGAWHAVSRAGNDQQALLKYYRALKSFLPTEFDLYAFGHKGELITPPAISLRSRFLSGKLWEITRCMPLEQNRRFQRLRKSLQTFLGNEFRMAQFLEGRDQTIPIITRQQHGLIYWFNDPSSPERGILMIFWEMPNLDFRLRQVIKRVSGLFAGGFVARDATDITHFGSSPARPEEAGEIFRKIGILDQKNCMDDRERIWAGRQVENAWIIAATQAGTADYVRWQFILVCALLLAAFLEMALYVLAVWRNLYLSIRLKLLALFLTAVISPVMGFAYLGYRYLDDRAETMLASVGNQSRQLLFALDESFKNAGASFVEDFKVISQSIINTQDDKVKRQLENKIEANDLISIELRDTSNAEIIFALQNELVFEGMREVSDAFSRYCIDNMLGSTLIDTIDPAMNMMVLSPESGMRFFFVRPGEVHQMSFGPVPLYIFWNIFKQTGGKSVYVYIVQSASRLFQHLIRQRLKTAAATGQNEPFILAAYNNKSGEWLPGKPGNTAILKSFTSRTLFSDKPVDAMFSIKGEEYLVIGQKGKYAGNFSLYAFYPFRLIDADIAARRRMIAAGILLFTIVALLAGWLLSDIFLLPVARLGDGVTAIKSRNSSFRIESSQQDEFGDLAVSFNHMIEDLKEMQLARDVQESLLPSEPPIIEGYQFSFANRMASAVGGDYFDVRVLDKENICVVVGDVTGHGVSSALVMAMAKAIVYQGLKENRDLLELFSDLNQAIHAYFSKPPIRKMITLFAAMINLPGGTGVFVNAGHNYPVKVSSDGQCEDLAAVHLPIGAVPVLRKMKTSSFSMQDGDSLIFYTDGIIEVTNDCQEQYGYDRFKAMLAENANDTPAELSRKLLNGYDSWLAGGEPDDDVTLVVLRKQAGASPE